MPVRTAAWLEALKLPHSVFALPFALVALLVAAGGRPAPRTVALVLACMVAARSAALAFNRWTDREFDARNPRTASRPSVTGAVGPRALLACTILCCAVLLACAAALNLTCLVLAVPALAVLLGYSYAKRFTSLSHFWLGLALGLSPVGAHLAVHGNLAPLPGLGARWGWPVEGFPLLLCAAVLLWTAGFDLIYACQDLPVDRADARLHSLPKRIGLFGTLILSACLHLLTVLILAGAGVYAGLGAWYFGALALVAALLVYEHWIVRPGDLTRVNTAFFTLNGAVSLLLFVAVLIERMGSRV